MENAELIKALKEDAEWAHGNEWETPITLGDHLDAAADALEAADKRVKELETIVTNAEKCDFENRTDCDYCENIQRAVRRITELEAAQRWIPVGDRLPRSNKPVQVYMPKLYMSVQTGFYDRYYGEDDDEWYEHWVAPSEVTHWMPLPQPPEKG